MVRHTAATAVIGIHRRMAVGCVGGILRGVGQVGMRGMEVGRQVWVVGEVLLLGMVVMVVVVVGEAVAVGDPGRIGVDIAVVGGGLVGGVSRGQVVCRKGLA
jgi:hypothetical protein